MKVFSLTGRNQVSWFFQKMQRNLFSPFFFFIFFVFLPDALAYNSNFHEKLTAAAIQESRLACDLNENLQVDLSQELYGPGYREFSSRNATKTVQDWIIYGSWKEDNPPTFWRAVHHFENPVAPAYGHERYLTDVPFAEIRWVEPVADTREERKIKENGK